MRNPTATFLTRGLAAIFCTAVSACYFHDINRPTSYIDIEENGQTCTTDGWPVTFALKTRMYLSDTITWREKEELEAIAGIVLRNSWTRAVNRRNMAELDKRLYAGRNEIHDLRVEQFPAIGSRLASLGVRPRQQETVIDMSIPPDRWRCYNV